MKGSKRKRKSTVEDASETYVSKLVDKALAKKKKEMYQLKGLDVVVTPTAILDTFGTNGSSHHVNPCRPGDSVVNRSDNSIKMQSLRTKVGLEIDWSHDITTGHVKGNTIRCTLVQIKAPGAAKPAWNDIFKATLDDNSIGDSFYAGVKLGNSDKYRVLRDEIVNVNPTFENTMGHAILGSARVTVYKELEWFIPLRDMEAKWDAQNTDGQFAGMQKNALVWYFRARNATTHFNARFLLDSRLRFIDT